MNDAGRPRPGQEAELAESTGSGHASRSLSQCVLSASGLICRASCMTVWASVCPSSPRGFVTMVRKCPFCPSPPSSPVEATTVPDRVWPSAPMSPQTTLKVTRALLGVSGTDEGENLGWMEPWVLEGSGQGPVDGAPGFQRAVDGPQGISLLVGLWVGMSTHI